MLKLLWCEFAKLRRKPLFFAAAAVSALIPLGCALFLPDFQEFTSGAEAVDGMMSTLFQMSAYLLLMPALVVLASNLLFEEQDNDTLKNLMTVPVSKPALALAKMALLFLFSIAFMAVGGLVILIFASNLLVNNAVSIAQELGVSEAVIGLTIVAAGTSMPELATSVVSALKKNPDIAIGNIVGSNLFNILAIAGTSSVVSPIAAKNVNYVDLLVMLGLTLLLLPLVKSGQKISRAEGWALILVYLCYLAWLLRDLI